MEGSEMKRDKAKTFKVSSDTLNRVNKIIKSTGKGDTEFFEELISGLEIENLTSEDNKDLPADLRKSFQVDVQKLKTATNSIISLFTSQMESISVEKNNWTAFTEQQLQIRDQKIADQVNQREELKNRHVLLTEELNELNELNFSLTKELDALVKQNESQEKLVIAHEDKIEDLTERINVLNQLVVEKDEALKKAEPLHEENRILQVNLTDLNRNLETMKENHPLELQKQADALRFEFEKEKLELYRQSAAEQEQVRTDTREKTELATRAFYTTEIQRLESAWEKRESDYISEIEKLREANSKKS